MKDRRPPECQCHYCLALGRAIDSHAAAIRDREATLAEVERAAALVDRVHRLNRPMPDGN